MAKFFHLNILLLFINILAGFAQDPSLESNKNTSVSLGTVSKGKLINGQKIPFKGNNYEYFSSISYTMLNRAYVNGAVKNAVLQSYKECETICPGMKFIIMECSYKDGGRIKPHHTHQNGLSIDFASPLLKEGKQCFPQNALNLYGYDMDFDNEGKMNNESDIKIDFETMAKHLYILNLEASKQGLKIEKVIFKTTLHDKLFSTEYGKKIRGKFYFAQKLTAQLNKLHDDHYHVDFAFVKKK